VSKSHAVKAKIAAKARVATNARIEGQGAGRFTVSGVLDATTVTRLLEQSREQFDGAERINVDLAAVTESDSSGLALLIEWLRLARDAGRKIHFENLPEQMMALARISEVDDLLTANGFEAPVKAEAQSA
jgi:phospholipid transport system transporter-binding protein